MKVICFHKPTEPNGFLSNWFMSVFNLDGVQFSSMEQYMMYSKAKLFGDTAVMQKILKNHNVAEVKALGRQVKGFNETVWEQNREAIVTAGLMAKFQQNNKLKMMLLNTGDSVLAECAVQDKIWGIGLSMSNPERFNPDKWRGKSLLGKCLMNVREVLRAE